MIITRKKKKEKKKERNKRELGIVDFTIPVDLRVKMKESKKKDKYLDIARELKKLWNVKVTMIPIVIDALGTVTKELVKGLEDLEIRRRVETIQTTALLRSARILKYSEDLRRLGVTQAPVKEKHLRS